jgi:hypothetical protein
VSDHEQLCDRARALLDRSDNSVLSDLLEANANIGLAIVELLAELRDELVKKR